MICTSSCLFMCVCVKWSGGCVCIGYAAPTGPGSSFWRCQFIFVFSSSSFYFFKISRFFFFFRCQFLKLFELKVCLCVFAYVVCMCLWIYMHACVCALALHQFLIVRMRDFMAPTGYLAQSSRIERLRACVVSGCVLKPGERLLKNGI